MPKVFVRDFDKRRQRAQHHDTPVQGEVRTILEESPRLVWEEFAKRADAFREKMIKSGRTFTDSTDLVREDRDR